MSLINDALKRARHEALRQDAEKGRSGYRAVPAHSRRSSPPWLLFVGGALVAVIVLGALVLWWPGDGPSHSVSERPTALDAVKDEYDGPVESAVEVPAGEDEKATATAAAPEGTPAASARTDSGVSTLADPVEPRSPIESESVSPPSRPVAPEAQRREVDPAGFERLEAPPPGERLEPGATYLRRAAAADGSAIELGGIAYSDNRPIAVINGSVVTPGDMIAGFTVIAIEPERVELETDGVRFYLALR